jgi:crossover junction endodeoxyribonuclease RuvC
MKVLGLDPGLTRTGYAFVADTGSQLLASSIGVIKTDKDSALPERLLVLEAELTAIIEAEKPDCVAFERIYFQVNTRTAMQVGEAAGVALLAAGRFGLEVFGYSPNEVKQALTGYGAADKRQMAAMTSKLLGIDLSGLEADAADAAAVAVAHLNSSRVVAALRRAL